MGLGRKKEATQAVEEAATPTDTDLQLLTTSQLEQVGGPPASPCIQNSYSILTGQAEHELAAQAQNKETLWDQSQEVCSKFQA